MKLQESCSNSILLCKIIYFVTSWNFACMVELEKYIYSEKNKEIYKKGGFWGPFIRTIFYYFFLAVFMVLFVVAILKSNLERISK